jgi:hypothetical protein
MSNFKTIAVQETKTGLNTQSDKKTEENDPNTPKKEVGQHLML